MTAAFILLMAAAAYGVLQQVIIASQGRDSLLREPIASDWKGKLSPLIYLVAIYLVAIYLVAIPTAFLSPRVSPGLFVLVALNWLIPDRRIENLLADKDA